MDVGNNPRRIYAIVRLAKALEGFQVKAVRAVPYQSVGTTFICAARLYGSTVLPYRSRSLEPLCIPDYNAS